MIVRYRNKPYFIIRTSSEYHYALDLSYLSKGRQLVEKIGIASCVPFNVDSASVNQAVDNHISILNRQHEERNDAKLRSKSLVKLLKIGVKFKYNEPYYGESTAIYLGKYNKKHTYVKMGRSNTIFSKTNLLINQLLDDTTYDLINVAITEANIGYGTKIVKADFIEHIKKIMDKN